MEIAPKYKEKMVISAFTAQSLKSYLLQLFCLFHN